MSQGALSFKKAPPLREPFEKGSLKLPLKLFIARQMLAAQESKIILFKAASNCRLYKVLCGGFRGGFLSRKRPLKKNHSLSNSIQKVEPLPKLLRTP